MGQLIHNTLDPFWAKGSDGKGANWNGRILEDLRSELQNKYGDKSLDNSSSTEERRKRGDCLLGTGPAPPKRHKGEDDVKKQLLKGNRNWKRKLRS